MSKTIVYSCQKYIQYVKTHAGQGGRRGQGGRAGRQDKKPNHSYFRTSRGEFVAAT